MSVIDKVKWTTVDCLDFAKKGLWRHYGMNLVCLLALLILAFVLSTIVVFIENIERQGAMDFSIWDLVVDQFSYIWMSTNSFLIISSAFYCNIFIRAENSDFDKLSTKMLFKANNGRDIEQVFLYAMILIIVELVYNIKIRQRAFSPLGLESFLDEFTGGSSVIYKSTTMFKQYLPYLFLIIILTKTNKERIIKHSKYWTKVLAFLIVFIMFSGLYNFITYLFSDMIYVFVQLALGDSFFAIGVGIFFQISLIVLAMSIAGVGFASLIGTKKEDPQI